MNVSLTPELERYINKKIESGLYQTASEVVRE
jgi:antitoxin ParD1/3/4